MAVERNGEILDSNVRPSFTPEGIPQGMDFFQWLFQLGLGSIKGDPNYYASGAAQPEEYRNLFQLATNEINTLPTDNPVRQQYYEFLEGLGSFSGDPAYYANGEAAPEEFSNLISVVSTHFAATGGQPGSVEPGQGPQNENTIPPLEILSSPSLQILKDSRTGLSYAQYKLPNTTNQFLLFEIEPEQLKALGLQTQGVLNFNTAVRQSNIHFGGNIAEVEGTGNFEEEVDRVVSLALDQRNLPDWIAQDEAALALLYVSVTEERDDDWFFEQIETLQSFKNRYPNLQKLKGLGLNTGEAIQAFTEFETRLKTLHSAAGFSPDAITPSTVGDLVSKGYSIDQVTESYGVWKRMNDHAPALNAFNEVLVAAGRSPLNATQMYDFLRGQAPQELYDIYEASAINEAAEATGFGSLFTGDDALSLALETSRDLSHDEAFQKFSNVAAQALRFRHELEVEQYGLDIDDLIDVSFGRAPRSGRTSADVAEVLTRITKAAEGALGERIRPFFGFDQEGRPQARSFGSLRQQS